MNKIIKLSNLFNYFKGNLKKYLILFIPILVYIINHFIPCPIFNITSSILTFFFYFGYEGLKFLLSYLNFKNSGQGLRLNIFELIGFSILIGIALNIIYGIIAIILGIYNVSFFYLIFYEILAIIFFIKKFRYGNCPVYKSFFQPKIKEILFILLLLIPTIWKIFIDFYFMPFPYYSGWDLFTYQFHTSEILNNNIRFIYGDLDLFTQEMLRPVGFSIIQANVLLSSNIEFYYLFTFNKIGYILTLWLSTIWLFLIILNLTKDKNISLIISLLISSFGGYGIITPQYFLPAAYSWQIGFCLIYLLLKYFSKENFKEKKKFIIFYFFILFLMFLFHFFTAVIMVICLLLILVIKSAKLKKYHFIIPIFLLLMILSVFILRSIKSPYLTSLLNLLFGTSSYFDFDQLFYYLYKAFPIILIFVALIESFCLKLKKKNKNYNWIILTYFFFLIFYFIPFPTPFRIIYIIVVYCYLIIAILLVDVKEFFPSIIEKLNISDLNRYKLKKIIYVTVTIILLCVSILSNFKIPNIRENIKVVDIETRRIYKSTYSLEEFNSALWIYNNVNIQSTVAITDPGTGLIYAGITGLFYYKFLDYWEEFRNVLINTSDEGLDIKEIYNIINELNMKFLNEKYLSKDHLLILTPRTHIILQTNDLNYQFGHYDKSWINFTLLDNIQNTSGINLFYHNEEVYIFNIDFNDM